MNAKTLIEEGKKLAAINQPFGILGAPGLGKTTIVKAIAEELDLPYVEIRAAEFEPIDFRGGMYLDKDEEIAKWFPAEIWPTEKAVICLDELTQATPDMISPLMKLVLGREIGKTKLHPETIIVMTGNRVEDRAGCTRLASALRDRFIMLTIEAEFIGWSEWYRESPEYNETILEYLSQHPEHFHRWDAKIDENQPSPRNWERVGSVIRATSNPEVLEGVIGKDTAKGFHAWMATHVNVPKVKEVLDGQKEPPEDPMLMKTWANRLAEYLCNEGYGHNDANLFELVVCLPSAHAVLFLREVADRGFSDALMQSPWKALLKKHASALKAARDAETNSN
tara:strand:- start:3402 stop:4412 length:1011 start_codon:yes stop_codon:yes gene_type:complete